MALDSGYLPEEYDELVVSRADKQRAKEIVEVIVSRLMEHSKYFQPKQYGVKIPFTLTIHESIPNDKVRGMTVMNRAIKYLSVITKVNMDFRPRVQNTETGQFFPIAITADLKQTLELMKVAASGIRPYLVNWYNKVIPPLIEEMDGKPNTKYALDDDGTPVRDSKHTFEILQDSDDNREKLQAMELFKDTHLVKLELLSNATTIDSALNYIRNKQG
jgi:hypothetical protein